MPILTFMLNEFVQDLDSLRRNEDKRFQILIGPPPL
jgi:hypothetical protein